MENVFNYGFRNLQANGRRRQCFVQQQPWGILRMCLQQHLYFTHQMDIIYAAVRMHCYTGPPVFRFPTQKLKTKNKKDLINVIQ